MQGLFSWGHSCRAPRVAGWVGAPQSSRHRPAGCSPPALGVMLLRAGRGVKGERGHHWTVPTPTPAPCLAIAASETWMASPSPEGSIAGSRGSDLAPRFCRWSRSRLAATLLHPGLELGWGFSAPGVRMREQAGEDTLSWLGPGDIAALCC